MAALESGNEPENKPVENQLGHKLSMSFTPGEVGSLLEMKEEFGAKQFTVSVHQNSRLQVVNVDTDTSERGAFIGYLFEQLRSQQKALKKMYPDIKLPK